MLTEKRLVEPDNSPIQRRHAVRYDDESGSTGLLAIYVDLTL